MNATDQARYKKMLCEVADIYLRTVQQRVPSPPVPVPGDPMPCRKMLEDSDMYMTRFLPPRPRSPASFWCSEWCNYHVCGGFAPRFAEDQGRRFEWHVGFTFAPGNKACNGPLYGAAVKSLLTRIQATSKGAYLLAAPGAKLVTNHQWKYLQLIRRFYTHDHPNLTAGTVAGGLVTLVMDSLSVLQNLQP